MSHFCYFSISVSVTLSLFFIVVVIVPLVILHFESGKCISEV